jgi:hypothetical protein
LARGVCSIGQGVIPCNGLFADGAKPVEVVRNVACGVSHERSVAVHHVMGDDAGTLHAQALTESVVGHFGLHVPACAVVRFHLHEVACGVVGVTFCAAGDISVGQDFSETAVGIVGVVNVLAKYLLGFPNNFQ